MARKGIVYTSMLIDPIRFLYDVAPIESPSFWEGEDGSLERSARYVALLVWVKQ